MDDLYYIPFVYHDDDKPCCASDVMEARAKCLDWFQCMHPDALIAVGPLFSFPLGEGNQAP
jgi:hypothetical protein